MEMEDAVNGGMDDGKKKIRGKIANIRDPAGVRCMGGPPVRIGK